jgi:hypothetical protein
MSLRGLAMLVGAGILCWVGLAWAALTVFRWAASE